MPDVPLPDGRAPASALTQRIVQDPDFQELVRRKNSISLVLTLITLFLYFTLMILVAYDPAALSGKVSGNMRWGIPLGIGLIVVCWILTGIYVRWANEKYDAMVENVKRKVG